MFTKRKIGTNRKRFFVKKFGSSEVRKFLSVNKIKQNPVFDQETGYFLCKFYFTRFWLKLVDNKYTIYYICLCDWENGSHTKLKTKNGDNYG